MRAIHLYGVKYLTPYNNVLAANIFYKLAHFASTASTVMLIFLVLPLSPTESNTLIDS